MGNGSSWETLNPEDVETSALSKRANKRLDSGAVSLTGLRTWTVDGDTKLGDAYSEYVVRLPEGEKKYQCSCYGHGGGYYRSRRMCSHVLAVVYYRKKVNKSARPKITFDEPDISHLTPVDFTTLPPPVEDTPINVEPVYAAPEAPTLDIDEPWSVEDPRLGGTPLPQKFTSFRDHQWKAIVEIKEHLDSGVKVVMLSAPTGSGKTLIGEAVKRLHGGRKVYACTTKSLQDQIAHDFSYADVIKGKSNYPTATRADLTAEDCTATKNNEYTCDWCPDYHQCAYQVAKGKAEVSQLPVLNIAYFLAESSIPFGSKFGNRDLVIIDEADTLEDQLMSWVEVVISANLRKSIGVYSLPKKTVPSDWVTWLEYEILPALVRKVKQLQGEVRTLYGYDAKKGREIKRLERLYDKIKDMLVETDDGTRVIENDWVMTGYEGSKDEYATVRFKPIRVDEYADEYLWSRGRQFLLMSATLISPHQMAEDLGLEDHEWEVVNVDSTFPVENRPVFIEAVANMTNKNKDTAWPEVTEHIGRIVDDNPGVRVLVHTVSYQLTKFIHEHLRTDTRMHSSILSYNDARQRERTLDEFLSIEDAVLLAPSFERGIDLPEEDCQVIIIAKVPYPYLGDKQINARLRSKGGQSWYAVQTIRAIAQMTGRGMRSADDWCDTYILDAQFRRLWRDQKRLFPKWWSSSLVLAKGDPKYKSMVKAAKKRQEARNE